MRITAKRGKLINGRYQVKRELVNATLKRLLAALQPLQLE
jgi:hypothetical protein